MDKVKFNLTDNEIREVIFSAFSSSDFWIKKIDRQVYNELKGTLVIVKPVDEVEEKEIQIQFLEERLDVQGSDLLKIRALYHAYYKMVTDKIPHYQEEHIKSLKAIEDFARENKIQVTQHLMDFLFEEGGFLSYDAVENKIKSYRMAGSARSSIKLGNHVEFYQLRPNIYDKPDREIKIGSVYIVDFDPVVGEEYGGRRPAVVIGYSTDKNTLVCVPLSTKDDQGKEIGEITGKKSYAVTSRVKIISPRRIYEEIDQLDQETYAEIVKNAQMGIRIVSTIGNDVGLLKRESHSDSVIDESFGTVDKDSERTLLLKIGTPSLINSKQFDALPQDTLHLERVQKELVYPTEEEYIQILMKKLDYLKQTRNLRFIGKSAGVASIDYVFVKNTFGKFIF